MNGGPESAARAGGRWKRVLRKGASWVFQALVVFGALFTLFIALTPQGRAGFHTALFVTQVLDLGVKPQTWFTDEPLRHFDNVVITPHIAYDTPAAKINMINIAADTIRAYLNGKPINVLRPD